MDKKHFFFLPNLLLQTESIRLCLIQKIKHCIIVTYCWRWGKIICVSICKKDDSVSYKLAVFLLCVHLSLQLHTHLHTRIGLSHPSSFCCHFLISSIKLTFLGVLSWVELNFNWSLKKQNKKTVQVSLLNISGHCHCMQEKHSSSKCLSQCFSAEHAWVSIMNAFLSDRWKKKIFICIKYSMSLKILRHLIIYGGLFMVLIFWHTASKKKKKCGKCRISFLHYWHQSCWCLWKLKTFLPLNIIIAALTKSSACCYTVNICPIIVIKKTFKH